MKHKTKLKCKQNVALYNPHDLNNAQLSIEMFDARADISNAQTALYCHSELGKTLFSAHIITVEYVACYSYYFVASEINITTQLTGWSVLNAVLLHYVTRNISNALLSALYQ